MAISGSESQTNTAANILMYVCMHAYNYSRHNIQSTFILIQLTGFLMINSHKFFGLTCFSLSLNNEIANLF